jgi:hypothetical protein
MSERKTMPPAALPIDPRMYGVHVAGTLPAFQP